MLSLLQLLGLFVLNVLYLVVSTALGGFVLSPLQLPGVLLVISWAITRTLALYVARGGKPRFPEWTLPLELAQATVRAIASNYGDNVSHYQNAATLRRQSESIGDLLGSAAHARNRTVLQPFELHGLEHLWVRSLAATTPDGPPPAHRVVVLYFHGGGYVTLSPRKYQSFASTLQARLHRSLCHQLGVSDASIQVDVLLANYRKGPEHRYPSAPLDALAMYKFLLEKEGLSPRQIIVMGDSAGGGLTMTTMLRLRDEDPALLPLAGVLLCPFVDREIKGDEHATPFCILADRLIEGFGAAYYHLEGPPSAWGDASPYHCDLRGLPPVHIQTGELDYILPHSKRLLQKAHVSGLKNWTLEIVPNMPHAFTMYPQDIAPSIVRGIEAVAQYCARQFASAIEAKAVGGDVSSPTTSLKKAPSF